MRYAFHVTGASMRLTSAVAASPCPAMLVVMLLYQNRSSSIRAQGKATGRGGRRDGRRETTTETRWQLSQA